MALIKQINVGKNVEERKYKLMHPPWKTIWRFLKKLKIELPQDPAISLPGIISKKDENINLKR